MEKDNHGEIKMSFDGESLEDLFRRVNMAIKP